jgi:GT2 family glycosyltransferase
MTIEVSIVIVSWNCKQLLHNCLQSLLDQVPAHSTEIIVVDNASSDGTPDAVRASFPSVKLIESGANLGFARGNNVGIEACTGNYICLINPDVVVDKSCIARMFEYMERHPDIGMLGPKIVGPDGCVQRSCMRTPTLWNQLCRALGLDTLTKHSRLFGGYLMKDFKHDELRDVDIINGCFWMVRREALNDVGMMDPQFWMYADDLDWCQRFRLRGWRIVFSPDAEALHFGGGSSDHSPLHCYIEMQRADLQYWEKYHGATSYYCFLFILWVGHSLRACAYLCLYATHASHRTPASQKVEKHLACVRWLVGRINRNQLLSV